MSSVEHRDSRYWVHLDIDELRGKNRFRHASSLVIGGEVLDTSSEISLLLGSINQGLRRVQG